MLGPIGRREILLGKNTALAFLTLPLCLVLALILQAFLPMPLDFFVANLAQTISMFLLYCLLANCLSILAPLPIATGSMQPSNIRKKSMIWHLAFFVIVPAAFAVMLVPFWIEQHCRRRGLLEWMPWCLLLSLAECAVTFCLYRTRTKLAGRLASVERADSSRNSDGAP